MASSSSPRSLADRHKSSDDVLGPHMLGACELGAWVQLLASVARVPTGVLALLFQVHVSGEWPLPPDRVAFVIERELFSDESVGMLGGGIVMPSRLGFAKERRLSLDPLGLFEVVVAAEELLNALHLVAHDPVAVGLVPSNARNPRSRRAVLIVAHRRSSVLSLSFPKARQGPKAARSDLCSDWRTPQRPAFLGHWPKAAWRSCSRACKISAPCGSLVSS